MKRLFATLALVLTIASVFAGAAPPPGPSIGLNLQLPFARSVEGDWGTAGAYATAARGGYIRTGALFWEAFWRGPKVSPDLRYIARQVEVAKLSGARLLILLQPTPHPSSPAWGSKDWWNPPPALWPEIVRCTNILIAEYDRQCKAQGVPLPLYQPLNEMTGDKPGGSGVPGVWSDQAHSFLRTILKGIHLPPARLIAPAISDLGTPTEAVEWRTCVPRSGSEWEKMVGARSIHVRVQGWPGISPDQYGDLAVATVNRYVEAVGQLAYERGKNRPVDVDELYVTPGDVGLPDASEEAIGAFRLAVLRRVKEMNVRLFIPYGAGRSVDEGEGKNPYLKYGGWAGSLWGFQAERAQVK